MSGTTTRRVAIVTGAAQGIGESIALRLADDGLDLGINDIASKASQLDAVAEALKSKGARVITLPGDVTDEETVKGMVQKTVDQLGGLDVMVANAGVTAPGAFLDVTLESYDEVWAVNVQGVMLCYKYAAEQMVKQGRGGRLIGASSSAGKKGTPMLSTYSMTKFAIRGMTHAAAEELAPHKITVNSYSPGLILTPPTLLPQDAENGGPGSTLKKLYRYPVTTQTSGPETVASIVSFLARPESHFITGQTIGVDGGLILD